MGHVSELFWNATLEELKQGYVYNDITEEYFCLVCNKSFTKGVIYSEDGIMYDAQKYVKIHICKEHGSMFNYLISMDKKVTGLTDHQKSLVELFYEGSSDSEIAKELQMGSTSTVRNHRFSLKEKQKQAKIFLAIMELMQQPPKEKHENENILKMYFKEGLDALDRFPLKQKRKAAVLKHIIKRFDSNKRYTEKEVNDILDPVYHDYVTLRRYLIEYGLMDRTPDGSSYWMKANQAPPANQEKELNSLDNRREIKMAFKQQKPCPAGVYQIKNNINGRIFVGSSPNLSGTSNSYLAKLDFHSHHNKTLHEDFHSHGTDAFSFEILETLDREEIPNENLKEALKELEEKWLNTLQPYGDKGYNNPKKSK